MIIGFTGQPRAGKDTAAACLHNLTGWPILTLAAPLHKAYKRVFGEHADKDTVQRMTQHHQRLIRQAMVVLCGGYPPRLPIGLELSPRQFMIQAARIAQEMHGVDYFAKRLHPLPPNAIISDIRFEWELPLVDVLFEIKRKPEIPSMGLPNAIEIINNGTIKDLGEKIGNHCRQYL